MLPTREFFYGWSEPVWINRSEKKNGDDEEDGSSSSKKKGKEVYLSYTTTANGTDYNFNYNPTQEENNDYAYGRNGRYTKSVNYNPTQEEKNDYAYGKNGKYTKSVNYNATQEEKNEYDHAYGKNGKDKKREPTVVMMKVPMCCSECVTTVQVPLEQMEGVKAVECNWFKEKVTVVATTAAPADILLECMKHFKESRMWNDDD
ncbi:unnamed protein product [Calypogeia fissa]